MKISFVIPTFNCAAFLPHAVKSCQEQTYKDIEIVIIDDCSTDTTDQYINWLLKQGDKRVVYQRNGKNMGRSYCRNFGNNTATGDIICVLDSDDLAINHRAEWTMKALKKCQVCYGSATLMNAIGIRVRDMIAEPLNKKKILMSINYQKWIEDLEKGEISNPHENMITHSSVGYLKSIALEYPYSEGKISDLGVDDWEQQIRMIKDGVIFGYIPDIICAYRSHGAGISKIRDIREVIKLKSEILEGLKCK